MYSFIRGTLVERHISYAVIDNQGIGYKVFVPVSTSAALPQTGDMVTLYTAFVVREDFQGLYGFLSPEEKSFFEQLIQLSGVGPKLAMSLLGHLPMQALQQAIVQEDVKRLSTVPGVGKKTAARLLVEMKGKCTVPAEVVSNQNFESVAEQMTAHDAIAALEHLGYSQTQAEKAVRKTFESSGSDLHLADLIRESLKVIKTK